MYEVTYYTKEKKRSSSKTKKFIRFFLYLLFVFMFIFVINKFLPDRSSNISGFINPVVVLDVVSKGISFLRSTENSKQLETIVSNTLKNDKENYGVVIKNLKTGERYYYNEHKVFDTASLYKLWVMAEAFEQIEEGNLHETDVLTGDVAELNKQFNISSESAELTDGVISWPVQNTLEQMITISDNYSALLLTQKIGLQNISSFLTRYGFFESKVGTDNSTPSTTALDTELFFEKLYNGQLISQTSSLKMLEILKKQLLNSKLPKYLPKDSIVAHKTGELDNISHDAGIIYAKKGDYIVVVLSKTKIPSNAQEKISELSKEVYNYFAG